MRKIKFISPVNQARVESADTALAFDNHEVRTVTDEQAALLLLNPMFHDVTDAVVTTAHEEKV